MRINKNNKPYLEITIQPNETYRFRYDTERDNAMEEDQPKQKKESSKAKSDTNRKKRSDKSDKKIPTVILRNYQGKAYVRCMLFQVPAEEKKVEESENNFARDWDIHPHELIIKEKINPEIVDTENHDPYYEKVSKDFEASFEFFDIRNALQTNYNKVIKQKIEKMEKKEKININEKCESMKHLKKQKHFTPKDTKKINKHKLVFGFTAFIEEARTKKLIRLTDTVYSNPVINGKLKERNESDEILKIVDFAPNSSPVEGGEKIIMLVDPLVDEDLINVRFFETADGKANGPNVWAANGEFSPSDVHNQCTIILTTPPYSGRTSGKNVIRTIYPELILKYYSHR